MTLAARSLRRSAGLAAAVVTAFSLAACGGGEDPLAGDDTAEDGASPAAAGTVTVGSADFTESQLLARIYVGALEAQGVDTAEPRLGIGAREAYLQGMGDGSINVIPEYTGALTSYYDDQFTGTEPNEVYSHLQSVLPADFAVLDPSAAENKDSITVLQSTAEEQGLRSISDLAEQAGEMSLGAPPEFKARPQGTPGLASVYGVTFGQERELGGQALVQALVNGQVDAANIFTTDPAFTQHDLVALEDDQGLFGSQNVVPLVTQEVAADAEAVEALNSVSEALTTEDLQQMATRIDVERADPAQVANEFLTEKGLG